MDEEEPLFRWYHFAGSLLFGLFFSFLIGEFIVGRKVEKRISRSLFLHGQLCSAAGSQSLLLFFQYLMIFSKYPRISEMLLISTLSCFLAILGPFLNMLFYELVNKSKLRVPIELTPDGKSFTFLFLLSSGVALLFNYFYDLQVFSCLSWNSLWFVLTVMYGYLTLDAWNFLRVAMKVERFEVMEKDKVVGEMMWKSGDWVEYLEHCDV